MSIYEVLNICYIDFLQLLRDAYISRMRRTEEGQEYLTDCWNLEQTEPDRKSLREQFGGEKIGERK